MNGAVFEPEHQLEFVMGDEQVGEGLETAISTLKKGQKARFTLKPNYAFGAQGDAAKNIPPNATVVYEVELVEFVKEKESWDMSPEEKVASAQKRKDEGNELYKVTSLFSLLLSLSLLFLSPSLSWQIVHFYLSGF